MSNEKLELLKKIKALGYSVSEISNETGIPAARMYKWYEGKGLPRRPDYDKLKAWVEGKAAPTNDFVAKDDGADFWKYREAVSKKDAVIDYLESRIKELEAVNDALKVEIDKFRVAVPMHKKSS